MANSNALKRSYTASQLGLSPSSATTGVWAAQLTGNLYSLHKAAAATTSVLNIPIPASPSGFASDDFQPAKIEVFYAVTTADLTTAPAATLDKLTFPGGTGTGLVARAAVTQAITFGGIDAIGKVSGAGAAGSHIAVVTITTPPTLQDNEQLVLELSMGEAATSVLDIFGITVTYQGRF